MAIIQPDPGPMFAQKIEERVRKFREEEIDGLVAKYREHLEQIAAEFSIDVQRYYDIRDNGEHVSVTLRLPKAKG